MNLRCFECVKYVFPSDSGGTVFSSLVASPLSGCMSVQSCTMSVDKIVMAAKLALMAIMVSRANWRYSVRQATELLQVTPSFGSS